MGSRSFSRSGSLAPIATSCSRACVALPGPCTFVRTGRRLPDSFFILPPGLTGSRMPFETTPRVVYRRNPLVEVVCQLRFPPILRILSREPSEFQDEIRDAYPLYEKQTGLEAPPGVAAVLSRLGVEGEPDRVNHRFFTEDPADRRRTISLARDFVAISEKTYRRWEVFRQEIERAKEALEVTYNPSFYSRVGLRYRDVIDPIPIGLEDRAWAELLNEGLLGILGAEPIRDRVSEAKSEFLLSLDEPDGAYIRVRHGLAKRDETGAQVYRIDADCFATGRIGADHALPVLDAFNRTAGNFFRWAIAPALHEALGPEPLDD